MKLFTITVSDFFSDLVFPQIDLVDIVEMLIIAFLIYQVIAWIKNTRAWTLLKGMLVIVCVVLIAAIFNMTNILWIAQNVFSLAITAIIVVMQPELRKALEELGNKRILSSVIRLDNRTNDGRFSDTTIDELVRGSFEMAKVRTGALIVIQQKNTLEEYEKTGITVDGLVTSQLLINIFEHNTPLHDGAVIVHGNRITSATCYLPLSDNRALSKELGTRHRAAVGISEVTDALTIVISEETGKVSVAYEGKLSRNLDSEELRNRLIAIQNKASEDNKTKRSKKNHERKTS